MEALTLAVGAKVTPLWHFGQSGGESSINTSTAAKYARLEGEIFIDNLLVRVALIIEMSRPALRHGSLNSRFQVASYLPS